jgi:hypothetical protein
MSLIPLEFPSSSLWPESADQASSARSDAVDAGAAGVGPRAASWAPRTVEVVRSLLDENVLFDLRRPAHLRLLRDDIARIARDMDDPERPPPMFWSGVPWPRRPMEASSDWNLVVSVGGTNTNFLLVRLADGEVLGLDRAGREVRGEALRAARRELAMPTPAFPATPTGRAMVSAIIARVANYVRPFPEIFRSVRHVLLSWGFPHRVIRTDEYLLGGISAITTRMTKDQAAFDDLVDRDIGLLFRDELERAVGWQAPVTVANDGVMALHFFLSNENRERYNQIGLFINGTGSNFCLAEPYLLRPSGVASAEGEAYEPLRLVGERRHELGAACACDRDFDDGSRVRRYFINYEIGSIELGPTRSRFDTMDDYPIESNVLSGGNAFEQQFRAFARHAFGDARFDQFLGAAREGVLATEVLEGAQISAIAAARGRGDVDQLLPGFVRDASDAELVPLVARAVIERSALHAAMILAAVTLRTRFGFGDELGRPDLLAVEGSVWRAPGYTDSVRECWNRLVVDPLRVEFGWETIYGASARGPVFVTVLQYEARQARRAGEE